MMNVLDRINYLLEKNTDKFTDKELELLIEGVMDLAKDVAFSKETQELGGAVGSSIKGIKDKGKNLLGKLKEVYGKTIKKLGSGGSKTVIRNGKKVNLNPYNAEFLKLLGGFDKEKLKELSYKEKAELFNMLKNFKKR
jgi:hypothetical protein